jgi:hypothetical protein
MPRSAAQSPSSHSPMVGTVATAGLISTGMLRRWSCITGLSVAGRNGHQGARGGIALSLLQNPPTLAGGNSRSCRRTHGTTPQQRVRLTRGLGVRMARLKNKSALPKVLDAFMEVTY